MFESRRPSSAGTRRRWLAAGAAWPALAWIGALRAQSSPPVLIGWLSANRRDTGRGGVNAFVEDMTALGWKLGAQYVLEERHADGHADRLPALAQELAAKKPAVIVAETSTAARVAAAAAPTMPIVLANGDPLAQGLVTNLARPGGMITGLSNVTSDLNQKVVELLLDALPGLQRVGFLADTTSSSHAAQVADARRTAERLRVEAIIVNLARPEDIEPAFERLTRERAQALVILSSVWFYPLYPRMLGLAAGQRLPVITTIGAGTRQGGLFSYGPDRDALVRRSAYYVDRILKGAKPGDLPIEQPTVFDLVVNLKTARQLGITMPRSIMTRATEVIE
jgi:putative tryptophan/tyrosine transport system substrate-binding protein